MRARVHPVAIASLLLVALVLLFFLGSRKTDQLKAQLDNGYASRVPSKSITNASTVDHKSAMAALNKAEVNQEDPRLIQLIRDYYIDLPSDKEYNLKDPSVFDTSQGQSKYFDKLLNSKTGGFFVECGAHDGDYLSNSLFFERVRSWNGILIEADPLAYSHLREKNRKVHSINACLSPYPYPTMVTFIQGGPGGKIEDDEEELQNKMDKGKG